MISIIVAIAENYAIGKNNKLLWHIPGDMRYFKKITSGHAIIMGKRTYESLPKKPLPGRTNIVITDDPNDSFEGCLMATSVEDALKLCDSDKENFIIGGASIYEQFLPLAGRLYLTKVHKSFEGDVFFPKIRYDEWSLVYREDFPPDEHNDFSYSYLIYERKKE